MEDMKDRKGRKKDKRKTQTKLVRLSGRALNIVERLHELSGGKRTYSEIIGDLVKNAETPFDHLIKKYDDLENVCRTYFNPKTARIVELLRPIVLKSAQGKFDTQFAEKKILEILDDYKSKMCEADEKMAH